jgi:hypothetical protein
LLNILRGALEGSLRRLILHGYVELNLGGIWSSFKLPICANVNGIRLRTNRGMFLGNRGNYREKNYEEQTR